MKLYFKFLLIAALVFVAFMPDVAAQCPMCKMAAESNLEAGGAAGKGLNAGILYMLATPYLLVMTLGLVWYRNRRKGEEEDLVN